ncbi:hypothetical protein [Streptomyces canus]|uniref:hypothetical protein n=1 Tax=Streptomyces canus TaxID=58343 RepID=UPI002E2D265E|nr:hypothetical protein [Streptomyces canus]
METVYERHRRWSADGTWKAVPQELQIEADAGDPDGTLTRRADRQERAVNIDSTSCRAHRKRRGQAGGRPPAFDKSQPSAPGPRRHRGAARIPTGADTAVRVRNPCT